ncbi:hypothetical protein [Salinispira pacifica]
MKRLAALPAVFVVGLIIFSACQNPASDGGVTISGTVDASYWSGLGPVTITISGETDEQSVEITLESRAAAPDYYGTFSITGVPSGSYTVRVSFDCNTYQQFGSGYPNYVKDNGSPVVITDTSHSSSYDSWTLTTGTITIDSDAVFEIYLGDPQPVPV